MRNRPSFAPSGDSLRPRVELVLAAADGAEWTLSVSAGIERFIGAYPRVDGIGSGGPLLRFRAAAPAA